MTDEDETQKTEGGLEIPIPTREEIERSLEEIAKPQKPLKKGCSTAETIGELARITHQLACYMDEIMVLLK